MSNNIKNINMQLQPPTLEPWKPGDNPEKDIIVLMSGGVDSSATALLLKNEGWNVVGVTMKIPVAESCDVKRSCCGVEAAYVSRDLGIPHYYLDVRDAFEKLVIEKFRRSYEEGLTPSPCIDCNTLFKFGLVWDFLEESFGISHLATGHYARIVHNDSHSYLARASDKSRDQSYFLYGIPKRRLEHLVLPLGEFTKPEVRDLTHKAHLPVARRQDSMELCFAGEGDYRNALDGSSARKGSILDTNGNVLGEHEGIANYTIGQRKGIGIAGGKPLYVTRINAIENTITIGTQEDITESIVCAEEVNVLIPEKLVVGERLYGKIRSQGEPTGCTVVEVSDGKMSVEFDAPQFAPTPGQRLVLYDDNENVVAGGVIYL